MKPYLSGSMSNSNSPSDSPKGVAPKPRKVFGLKMIRKKSKLYGEKDDSKQSAVSMRRSLSQIKEQEETVVLQIQSKINPTPSFDVIRTISVQHNEPKQTFHDIQDTPQKNYTYLNRRVLSTCNTKASPEAIQDIFKDYHRTFHNRRHHNKNVVPLRQSPVCNDDSDGCSCYSDSEQSSQHSYEGALEYSVNRDVDLGEEYCDGYTIDSSMSSITIPVPVRTDSITTNELFNYFSKCAANLAATISNICVSDESDNHVHRSEDMASTVQEISVQRKIKKN